jgi:NTP pyrophosphatase (non-canonical NTP hydrolase)
MVVRTSVRVFAEEMERQLADNDWKGGWGNEDPFPLLKRINQELEELTYEMNVFDASESAREKIKEEAADVANFCMMIADIYSRIGVREYADATNSNN